MNNIFFGFFGRRYINEVYNENFEKFEGLQKELLIVKLIV
jgi:hypothetical protein